MSRTFPGNFREFPGHVRKISWIFSDTPGPGEPVSAIRFDGKPQHLGLVFTKFGRRGTPPQYDKKCVNFGQGVEFSWAIPGKNMEK